MCFYQKKKCKNLELSISILTASAISEYKEWLISKWKTKFASARLLLGPFFTKSVPRNDCVSVQISEEVFFLRLNEVSVLLLANYLVNYANSDRASKTTFSIGV